MPYNVGKRQPKRRTSHILVLPYAQRGWVLRHNVTLYARRHHAFGPRVKDLHVVIDEDESGAFNVVADNLDEVLDPYRADRGYAVLGPWEDDYAYRIDCRVETGLAAAANYMGLGSKPEALAAFRARFRAWFMRRPRRKSTPVYLKMSCELPGRKAYTF